MPSHIQIHIKENVKRILLLAVFFIVAFIVHTIVYNFEQEVIADIFIMIIFSFGLAYEYISIFRKELPKIEYFISIFFIIAFTIILFATIYASEIKGQKSYFIENGQIIFDLPFSDAFYFSATTLSSVAYGDILPVGVFRYFAILEIFAGLLYIGTMIYIITKHLDGKKN
jgi:potassium channel LctB